jgi:hypothetical protein
MPAQGGTSDPHVAQHKPHRSPHLSSDSARPPLFSTDGVFAPGAAEAHPFAAIARLHHGRFGEGGGTGQWSNDWREAARMNAGPPAACLS